MKNQVIHNSKAYDIFELFIQKGSLKQRMARVIDYLKHLHDKQNDL